jgi:ABC-type nitrate/sulfonate/bicarbonate transport system ATPase subunit
MSRTVRFSNLLQRNNMPTTRPYKYEERLLTIKGAGLSYGTKQIFRDINLHIDNVTRPGVNQGQCVALLGPSGIGKTQLFRCIAGMQPLTVGSVDIGPEHRQVAVGEVGVVQQSYPLLAHRTIRGNLSLVCDDGKKIIDLLTRFGLAEHADKYPLQLSGGQRQRVAIIQQMISSRHMLMMDEPFSGLDIIAKNKVCELITEVNLIDELNTTIFTTHDLESAVMIADRIWVMGREHDAQGKEIPGATIVKEFDLIERDLAWQPDVTHHKEFQPMITELRDLFVKL